MGGTFSVGGFNNKRRINENGKFINILIMVQRSRDAVSTCPSNNIRTSCRKVWQRLFSMDLVLILENILSDKI